MTTERDNDEVDDLLVQLLREQGAVRDAQLAMLCERHPQKADVLRRRYAFLREAGLLDLDTAQVSMPERLGGFRVIDCIGQGGMGVVYLAEQESLGRRVALKIVQPGAGTPPRVRERFRREVQAISSLDHPNICPAYDAGEIEGVPYLAMRYVDGETLAKRIAREQRGARTPAADGRRVAEVVAIGEQLARALHAAHEQGLVHRDVKPGNVMLEAATGKPLLLDFGLAQLDDAESPTLTMSGDRLGTPAYMAPEQVAGTPADRRSDVYAIGATLYEAVTGCVPHRAPTREALYRRILSADITGASHHNAQVPRDLEVVLATALERDPQRRYHTAAQLADDLGRVQRHEPILARAPGIALRVRRWCQRNPYAATALCVLAAALVVTIVLLAALDRTLTERNSSLRMREAFDLLAGNPEAAMRCALSNVREAPTPEAVAAVRAALHAPAVATEILVPGQLDFAFDATSDGAVIAWCTSDKRLCVWRDGGHTEARPISGDKPAFGLRLSPDGSRIAIAGNDAPAMVFDLQGSLLHQLQLPEPRPPLERTFSIAWHPDGSRLAVGTGAADPKTGQHAVQRRDPAGVPAVSSAAVGAWPWHLTFTSSDELVAAPGAARHPWYRGFDLAVQRFDKRAAELSVHRLHQKLCMDMAVSRGLVATAGHDGNLVLWRHEREPITVKHPSRIYTVDAAPDGAWFVTACDDGGVRRIDRTGQLIDLWRPNGNEPVVAAVVRPDGKAMLVRLERGGRQLHTLDGRLLATLPGSELKVRAERFLGDGRLLTFDRDRIRIWHLQPADLQVHTLPPGPRPAVSPDGARFVHRAANGEVTVRDWGGEVLWSAKSPTTGWCLDDAGRSYAIANDRKLVIHTADGLREPTRAVHWIKPIFKLSCAPSGGFVAASPAGEQLRVLVRTPTENWRHADIAWLPKKNGVRANATTPVVWRRHGDGWRLLLGSRRGVLEYGFADDKLTFIEAGGCGDGRAVEHITVSVDGQRLAASYGEHGLRLYDRDGVAWRQTNELAAGVPISHLAFACRDRLLATSAQQVRILDGDFETAALLRNIDETVFVAAHGLPGGDKIVTIAANNVLREWWLEDARVIDEAERRSQ